MPAWVADGASHFDWMDERRVVVTRKDDGKWRHLLIDTDGVKAPKPLAPDVLTRDGHCTFSPDGRWMITDTYPDSQRRQHLFVMDVKTQKAARLASFHSPPEYRGDWRCEPPLSRIGRADTRRRTFTSHRVAHPADPLGQPRTRGPGAGVREGARPEGRTPKKEEI